MIVNDHEVFEYVKTKELNAINQPRDASPVGLALSGGGIRSASFNLGVIQSLAKQNLLGKFDYLSTVSGGGYIGSWLSAFIHRKAGGDVKRAENLLNPDLHDEDPAIGFLRDFSNYLTPRKTLLSNDSLAAAATYFRNLLLNQTLLITTLALLLLTPYLATLGGEWLNNNLPNLWSYILILILLLISVTSITWNLMRTQRTAGQACANFKAGAVNSHCCYTGTSGVCVTVVFPILLAAWLLNIKFDELIKPGFLLFALLTGFSYTLLWTLAWLNSSLRDNGLGSFARKTWRELAHMFVWTFTPGFLGGMLLWFILKWLANRAVGVEQWPWLISWLGIPIVVSVFAIIVVYHIGLMARLFTEEQREWWSRLGGMLTIAVLAWLGLFAISIYGPPFLLWFYQINTAWFATSGFAWLTATIGGVLVGHGPVTPAKANDIDPSKRKAALELFTKVAPYIFILGLLPLIAFGLQCLLALLEDVAPLASAGASLAELIARQVSVLAHFQLNNLLEIFTVFALVTLILAYRININLFSLHQFYRYRLTRAYLGASRESRDPNPFTGFDPLDDLDMKDLAEQRPFHLINAALNFTAGGRLAWQDRKAANFVFAPKYCGYTLPNLSGEDFYLPTDQFAVGRGCPGGLQIGKALAISGAAVSPNMGYHSSPGMAFLLTFFNLRLGSWIGNPRFGLKKWRRAEPRFGLYYLLSELFGFTDLRSHYAYLSDGGHFENTGAYELIRRECETIVICDAGADPKYQFEDLANLIRKSYTDFGVKIVISIPELTAAKADEPNQCLAMKPHCVGDIIYPGGKTGKLILLKPSLAIDKLPADLANFFKANPDFPQHTTLDQWFDEAEFESYRKLGFQVAEAAKQANCLDF